MQKTVVITGASRGLGLEFCRQYLSDGYRVYACARSPERSAALLELKQQFASSLELIPLDITKSGMIHNLAFSISEPVDILINNAGIYGPRDLAYHELNSEAWMEVLEIDTVAPLMVSGALADHVAKSHEKKIVFISSKMGSIADNQKGGSYIYRSAKAALNAAAKSLAIDIEPKGVSVVMLHPGWVRTDMGGAHGAIDAPESVSGMRQVISQLSLSNSGSFINYDGAALPW